MKQNEFYKTSPHGDCGTNVMFWLDGSGYGSNIDQAEIYSREDAQRQVDSGYLRNYNEQELFLSVKHVNELSEWRVDCQYVKKEYPEYKDPKNEYVSYKKGRWDGNDLAFASSLSHSFNYEKAKTFIQSEIENIDFDEWVVVPKSHTDEIARRTFQFFNVNRKKMISGAGVIGIRKPRAKRSSGKERWNCPCCGRIVWQYHPYEFMGCANIDCDEWKPSYERG